MAALDREAFLWVVQHRADWLDPLFVALSLVGNAGLLWIALAPLLALLARRGLLATTALAAAAVWCADLIALGIKEVVERPRPFETLARADPLVSATVGASLPSGHAATSFAGLVVLGALFRRTLPALAVLALAMSFSRVYVGAHYPFDAVAGAALGAAVGAVVMIALPRIPRPPWRPLRRSGPAPPPG